jgi:hypothetical protein
VQNEGRFWDQLLKPFLALMGARYKFQGFKAMPTNEWQGEAISTYSSSCMQLSIIGTVEMDVGCAI